MYSGIERKSAVRQRSSSTSPTASRFDTDILYTDRESFAQNAGYPFQSAAFERTPVASADSYFNPLGNQATGPLPPGVRVSRSTSSAVAGKCRARSQNGLTTYRFSGAFEGSLRLGERFCDWDVGYLYNQNKGVQISTGNLNTAAVAAGDGPVVPQRQGQVQCGTPDNPIHARRSARGPVHAVEPAGAVGLRRAEQPGRSERAGLPVPAGPGAVGNRTPTCTTPTSPARSSPCRPVTSASRSASNTARKKASSRPTRWRRPASPPTWPAGPTGGGYSLDEIYGELSIPLLADMPFAQELSLSLATRYSDYDTFGDTTNSKFGFKWKPLDSAADPRYLG